MGQDISESIAKIVASMRCAEGREKLVGGWIQKFEWETAQPVVIPLDDLIYLLFHARGLQTLSLPTLSKPAILSIPLQLSAASLRHLLIRITPAVFHEAVLVKNCQYLEVLSVFTDGVDWSEVQGWNFPRLEHLSWRALTSPSQYDLPFLQRCSFPNLSTLDLLRAQGSQSDVDYCLQTTAFLQNLPRLKTLRTLMMQPWFSGILPFLTASTLNTTYNLAHHELITHLSPSVRILKLACETHGQSLWAFLDHLLDKQVHLEQIHVNFHAHRPVPDRFSWIEMPQSYEVGEELEERQRHYNSFIFRLLGYAHRLSGRGILICDSRGLAATVTQPAVSS
jgi:hypothetical protein